MQGRSHLVVGAAFALSTGALMGAPIDTQIAMTVVGLAGGLLPDLDHPNSTFGKLLPRWFHKRTPGHRGITHSFLFVGFVWLLAWGIPYALDEVWRVMERPQPPYLAIALTVGTLSHLLADAVTTMGAPFFYPSRFMVKLLGPKNFKTGSPVERVAVLIVCVAAGIILLYPVFEPAAGRLYTAPQIYGVPTKAVLISLASVMAGVVVLSVYSIQKQTKKGRSRRKRPSTHRRPARR